jgi:hypothetical protein
MTDQAAGGFASIALPSTARLPISFPYREVAALLAEALNLRSLKPA